MTAPIQGYKIESFVPDELAADPDFHVAMRRRLEDLMQMQGFDQQTRVEVRVLSEGETQDCPLRPGFQILEAAVVVNEYDLEVPAGDESDSVCQHCHGTGCDACDARFVQASPEVEHHEPMDLPESQDVHVEVPVATLQPGVTIDSTGVCTTCGNPVIPHNYRHPITTT